jgi:hypothetical protein
MEIIEPTQEEIIAQGYNPGNDPEIRKDTIVIDPDKTPTGDGWEFYMTTPIQKKHVYKNRLIEEKNNQRVYYQSTTPYYRGLLKIAEAQDINFKSSVGRERFNNLIITFCQLIQVDGPVLSLARYIQNECYQSFLNYLARKVNEHESY